MSDRKPTGTQVDTINRFSPQVSESFNLPSLDAFVTGLGVDFTHFRAMPSPIGKNDRGDLRRNDGVDTITTNGMIYRSAGVFTATMTDNDRKQKRSMSGVLDPSEARLVLPRFYNKKELSDGDRIYLMPGDRLYISDPQADTLVANAEELTFQEGIDNEPLFPIVKIQDKILDSRGTEYAPGRDYALTPQGNISWLSGGNSPGVDPLTGKGRVYSVRYLYKAFYYVVALPKEVRISNVTTNGVRKPERMAMHAIIVREFIFHQQNRGDKLNQNAPKSTLRQIEAPKESVSSNNSVISVDMANISEE